MNLHVLYSFSFGYSAPRFKALLRAGRGFLQGALCDAFSACSQDCQRHGWARVCSGRATTLRRGGGVAVVQAPPVNSGNASEGVVPYWRPAVGARLRTAAFLPRAAAGLGLPPAG